MSSPQAKWGIAQCFEERDCNNCWACCIFFSGFEVPVRSAVTMLIDSDERRDSVEIFWKSPLWCQYQRFDENTWLNCGCSAYPAREKHPNLFPTCLSFTWSDEEKLLPRWTKRNNRVTTEQTELLRGIIDTLVWLEDPFLIQTIVRSQIKSHLPDEVSNFAWIEERFKEELWHWMEDRCYSDYELTLRVVEGLVKSWKWPAKETSANYMIELCGLYEDLWFVQIFEKLYKQSPLKFWYIVGIHWLNLPNASLLKKSLYIGLFPFLEEEQQWTSKEPLPITFLGRSISRLRWESYPRKWRALKVQRDK